MGELSVINEGTGLGGEPGGELACFSLKNNVEKESSNPLLKKEMCGSP